MPCSRHHDRSHLGVLDSTGGIVSGIGTLGESSLHAALKAWYALPDDAIESEVDGYFIDIKRDDLLIEIQTGNFSGFKRKLGRLLEHHRVLVVYPVAVEKWIVRETAAGEQVGRRKSPKKGRVEEIFKELVRIPDLISHSHISIEVAFVQIEEFWRDDGKGSWRRKRWSIHDRHLLAVTGSYHFAGSSDYLDILPADLAQPFSNRDLAAALDLRPVLAQKMTYTLRRAGFLQMVGKRGNAKLYKVERDESIASG